MRCLASIYSAALPALLLLAVGPVSAGPRIVHPRLVRPPLFHPIFHPIRQPLSNPAVVALVRRMLVAQNRLTLEGTMVTQTPQGTFVQHAVLAGARAQRFECLNPPANRGEVIVDNGRVRYHSTPAGTIDVGPSQMPTRRVRVPQVMQEIKKGNLIVQRVGQGTVAGHSCAIVRVGPPYQANWYEYWIDPTNGAQLRIEQYDAAGQRLSATYFTDVTYNPPLAPRLFAPLRPGGTSAAKPRPMSQPTVASDAQAGFPVLQPTFLPPGFHFQSSVVRARNGKNLVKLAYGNGLDALTLVETPDKRHQGPLASLIRNPRPGVVITRRAGLVIVLVGSLDEATLESVLNSIH